MASLISGMSSHDGPGLVAIPDPKPLQARTRVATMSHEPYLSTNELLSQSACYPGFDDDLTADSENRQFGPITKVLTQPMDPYEQATSVTDDLCHDHSDQNGSAKEPAMRRHTSSIDSHERYHSRHIEASEIATEPLSDQDANLTIPVHDNQLKQLLLQMQQRIAVLESSARIAEDGAVSNDSRIERKIRFESDPSFDPSVDNVMKQVEVIPKLREVTWVDFMNKYETNQKEYAIELMVGEPEYKRKGFKTILPVEIAGDVQPRSDSGSSSKKTSIGTNSTRLAIPNRIRINSSQIRNCLATIDKHMDASAPVVMLRPFKFLVHNESTIRNFADRLTEELTSIASNSKPGGTVDQSDKQISEKELNLRHIQCLLEFFDLYLKPTISRLRKNSAQKISFRDLWYIFRPGDDIFMPLKNRQTHVSSDPMMITDEMFQGRYERLWRVIGVGGGRPNLTNQDRNGRVRFNPFKVNCYYIDFDGVYFCPVIHSFSIQPYSGERDILSLEFFPLRFLKEAENLKEQSLIQGKLVFNALLQSHTHFYYRGPTLTTHPCGCPIQNETMHQDHVESEVIIDYRTALLKHPSWKPNTSLWKPPPSYPNETNEKFRVRHWNDYSKSRLIRAELDTVYVGDVDLERAVIFKESARIFDLVPSGWLSNAKSVPENDVAMLSPRIFAFVLRTRSFAPIWLWGLEKISAQTDGLHNLQLRNNSFKETIHALVRTHYLQINSPRHRGIEYDIVRGKGKGLVFLLHGAPGVGKTFTAESVAAANGRPLFQITCGDLGLTPSDVEKALQEIFRYAQSWNCVLLLDECDIFLTQRTKTDLKRNSLVSVFLRVLEWYSGVLFLTTNRVGTLDSAVKSRITWSTYYPPLDFTQTRKIWDANLDFLEQRNPNIELDRKSIRKFAKEHFLNNIETGSNWNGRQIQNAFKIAVSLAEWETLTNEEQHATTTGISEDSEARKLQVTASHFGTVAVAAEAFDDYLHEATGLTEAQRAFNAMERADTYLNEEETQEKPVVLEPSTTKQRTSFSKSVQYHSSNQLSPSKAGRRPSASPQNIEQPTSRRSSYQQIVTGTSPRNNSGAYKNDSGPAPGFRTTTFNHAPSVNRSQSDNAASLRARRSPLPENYGTSSGSDLDTLDVDQSTEEVEIDDWA